MWQGPPVSTVRRDRPGRMVAEEFGETLPGGGRHDPVLGPQDISGLWFPDQPGRPVVTVGRMCRGKVGAPVGRSGGTQGQDAPGPVAEGFGTVRPSNWGCPATTRAANNSTLRSTGMAPRIWRPIIAPAKAGAARLETLRLRVRAWGWVARTVR